MNLIIMFHFREFIYRPSTYSFLTPFSVSDVGVLVIMVTNEAQAESVLYGDLGAVSGNWSLSIYCPCIFSFINSDLLFLIALSSGASIILSSTVSPGFVSQLERRLQCMSFIWHNYQKTVIIIIIIIFYLYSKSCFCAYINVLLFKLQSSHLKLPSLKEF